MTCQTLLEAIADGERILLDASALIAYLDTVDKSHLVARHVVDELVASGRDPAVVSTVTLMEVLIRPLRASPPAHHTVLGFLRSQPYLDLVPVDEQVAQGAAHLRATLQFSAPDALVVGTGLATQVHHLVANDLAWRAKLLGTSSRIGVVLLADHLPMPPSATT